MQYIITMELLVPVEVVVGDVVIVNTSFNYKGPEQNVPVYAGIGKFTPYGFGVVQPNENAILVSVNSPNEFTSYPASIPITITETLTTGTYDIMAYIPGHPETIARADGIIIVSGPSAPTDWLGPMMMLMMMGLVVSMVGE